MSHIEQPYARHPHYCTTLLPGVRTMLSSSLMLCPFLMMSPPLIMCFALVLYLDFVLKLLLYHCPQLNPFQIIPLQLDLLIPHTIVQLQLPVSMKPKPLLPTLHQWPSFLLHHRFHPPFPQHQHFAINLSAPLARPTLWQSLGEGSQIQKSSKDSFGVAFRELQTWKPLLCVINM